MRRRDFLGVAVGLTAFPSAPAKNAYEFVEEQAKRRGASLYASGREGFLTGGIDWDGMTFKVKLLDEDS